MRKNESPLIIALLPTDTFITGHIVHTTYWYFYQRPLLYYLLTPLSWTTLCMKLTDTLIMGHFLYITYWHPYHGPLSVYYLLTPLSRGTFCILLTDTLISGHFLYTTYWHPYLGVLCPYYLLTPLSWATFCILLTVTLIHWPLSVYFLLSPLSRVTFCILLTDTLNISGHFVYTTFFLLLLLKAPTTLCRPGHVTTCWCSPRGDHVVISQLSVNLNSKFMCVWNYEPMWGQCNNIILTWKFFCH